MPYMINVVVAALSLLVFVTLTTLFQVNGEKLRGSWEKVGRS